MFNRLFGNYLVESELISSEMLERIYEAQKVSRLKLGFIAVEEGFMTQKEAEEVNSIQLQIDRRFGDIAVEKGFLTEAQLKTILSKQKNPYLSFAQAAGKVTDLTPDVLSEYLMEFKSKYNFSALQLEAIKNDDINTIVKCFSPFSDEEVNDIYALCGRMVMRLVDDSAVLKPDSFAMYEDYYADIAVCQQVLGDSEFCLAVSGSEEELLGLSRAFAREDFPVVNDAALDAVCEFVGDLTGVYVSAGKDDGRRLSSEAPLVFEYKKFMQKVYSVTFVISGSDVSFILFPGERVY